MGLDDKKSKPNNSDGKMEMLCDKQNHAKESKTKL